MEKPILKSIRKYTQKLRKIVRACSSFLYIISSAGCKINNASFRNLTASNTLEPILTVYKFGRYFGGVFNSGR